MKEYKGRYVSLMLCSDCNNHCEHCYISYTGSFTEERLKELIPILKKKYKVLLNGTEPIIHKEYLKFYPMCENHIMMTNGIALQNNELLMDELLENGVDEIAISYHIGIQDKISRITTKELDELIQELKVKGFKVKLMCSLSQDNYQQIGEVIQKALELKADRIRFTNFINQGSATHQYGKDVLLDSKQIAEVLQEIKHQRSQIPKDTLYIERCGSFGRNPLEEDHFTCLAASNMVAITPDEKVYACIFDTSPGNEIGYIDNEGRIMLEDGVEGTKDFCKILTKYNGVQNGKKT